MTPVRPRSLAVATAIVLLLAAAPAVAGFSSRVTASPDLATATLQPPTAPAVQLGTCTAAVGDGAVVNWTASTSTWAGGYDVLRSTTSGGPYTVVGQVSGVDTTSYTDTGLLFQQTYHYVVRSFASSWTSVPTVEVSVTTRTAACA